MAYPSTSNPKVSLLIDGVWTDITSYVRAENGQPSIRITRGRANEQGRTSAQTCTFTLNNRDGRFSNRNPTSPYYGLIPRNTQVRVAAGALEPYLLFPRDYGDQISGSYTADAASLDITGDIEIRAEIWPVSWRAEENTIVASKYFITGEQRSWALYITPEGKLTLAWTTLGTLASLLSATSSVAVPATTGRLCIKATLDVVNGANKSVAFYTSDSIDGTYTQLGVTQTTAGNTSIFSSTAKLYAGSGQDFAGIFSGAFGESEPFMGRFYKLRVYNGIAGSIVANPDYTAVDMDTVGASFADSTGKTWTVNDGETLLGSDRIRFVGELTSLPQRWDKSGRDVWVPVEAAGLIRRLSQGSSPLSGPIYRAMSNRALTGYWPLEDGADSLSAASAVSGVNDAITTAMTFASDTTLPGATTTATFTTASGRFQATPLTRGVTAGTVYFTFYFKLPSLPGGTSTFTTLTTTGSARKIVISVTATTFVFDLYDNLGVLLDGSSVSFGTGTEPDNQWLAMNVVLLTNGANVDWYARWSNVAAESFVGIGPRSYAGTVGVISGVNIAASGSASFVGAALAHIQTAATDLDFVDHDTAQAANAYLGETAGVRIDRLTTEEGMAMRVYGNVADSETMGYQTTKTFMDLVYECVDADGGILGEARDQTGALTYRTRTSMSHRRDCTLDYDAHHLAEIPEATEDDNGITNDVTVRRVNASSGRREITTGTMSVSEPPDGISRYATDVTLNVELDSRLSDIASWKANLGSVDEARYPRIAVGMHRTVITADTALSERLRAIDLGDTLLLADVPSWLPPDDVLLLTQGYDEELGKFLWTINFNTTPATLYNIGRYDYDTEAGTSRYDHATSTLSVGCNSSAVSLTIAANSGTPFTADLWSTTAEPYDVMIGGEQMTVTVCTGASSPQTFTVTRSVNGVVKAHNAGERVRLYTPVYYRL